MLNTNNDSKMAPNWQLQVFTADALTSDAAEPAVSK